MWVNDIVTTLQHRMFAAHLIEDIKTILQKLEDGGWRRPDEFDTFVGGILLRWDKPKTRIIIEVGP